MKSTTLEGLYTWGVWQADRRIDFNGFYWSRPSGGGGGVFIDPMELSEDRAAFAAEQGGAKWVLVTNADHLRAAADIKERFGAEVLAPARDRERFGEREAVVDGWFTSSADLPAELAQDIDVYAIRGGKSPVEIALHLKPLQALVFGDVVRSHVSGQLMLLPDAKLADRAKVIADLALLAELDVEAILLGDGDSFFTNGAAHFGRFLAQLG